MDIILSLILGALVVFITLKKKAFTVAAAICAFCILVIASFCISYVGIVSVLFSYSIIFIVDLVLGEKSEKITKSINKKHGARDIVQVLSNGLAATIAAILAKVLNAPLFALVYVCALTECLADSLASDVGVLSKKDPIDICRFKRIKKGLSGGISVLGTFSALAGCLAMCIMSYLFFGFNIKVTIVVLIIPMIGIIIDSILGSLLQAKYICQICGKATEKTIHCNKKTKHIGGLKFINNDAVNIISNILTTAIASLYILLA